MSNLVRSGFRLFRPTIMSAVQIQQRQLLHKRPKRWSLFNFLSGQPSESFGVHKHIVQVGDPVLRIPTEEVDLKDLQKPEFQFLLQTLKRTLEKYDAVGVSAPQIGVPLKMFAIQLTSRQISGWDAATAHQRQMTPIPLRYFVNPDVKIINSDTVVDKEGCCSIYGYSAEVPRAKEIEIRAFDETGKPVLWRVRNWTARIIQHEMDHLRGVLFTDKMQAESLTFNYWQTVNNRKGNFKIGFGGVDSWKKFLYPKLKQ